MSITTVLSFTAAVLFLIAGFINISNGTSGQASIYLALGAFWLIFTIARRRRDSNHT